MWLLYCLALLSLAGVSLGTLWRAMRWWYPIGNDEQLDPAHGDMLENRFKIMAILLSYLVFAGGGTALWIGPRWLAVVIVVVFVLWLIGRHYINHTYRDWRRRMAWRADLPSGVLL